MKTNIVILCIVALAAAAIVLPASMQQSAKQIYQSGVYKEDVEGSLEEAIAAYQEIIGKYPSDGPVAAKAWLHIGLCYEKLGDREAQNAYEQLIKGYPDQKQEVAMARERLAKLIGSIEKEPVQPIFRKIRILTGNDGDTHLSPDGQKISLVSDSKLWIMPLSGKLGPDIPGAPSELDTENVPVSWMAHAWSADGKWIAFNEYPTTEKNGNRSIYIVPSKGGIPQKIYENYCAERTVNYRISLSPNGKTLAFSSVDLEKKEQHIYAIPVDGGSPKQLVDIRAREPVFSPDGSIIAFVEDKDLGRGGGGLWIVPAQGGTPTQVAEAVNASSPVWSPSGTMIAYLDDGAKKNQVNFVPIGESGRATGTRFTIDAPEGIQDVWLLSGWSPDNRIGAIFTKPGETGLYTLPAKGGKAMQVAVGGGQPRWSPDGKRIYFIKDANNKTGAWQGLEIASIPAEGGESTTVPLQSVTKMYIPSFGVGNRVSPDGKRIVFSGRTQYDPINFLNNDIWILPVEGGIPKNLTVTPKQSSDMYPCWSPDGKTIAFVRTRIPGKLDTNDYKADIYFVRTNGGEPTPLTAESDSVNFGPIEWSPDGKFLAYFSKGNYDSGPVDLRIISAQGGGKSRVIGSVEDVNPGSQFTWSPDSKKMAFDGPDGKRIKILSIEDGSVTNMDTGLIHSNVGARIDWSPDGEKFVFLGGTGESEEFLVMENFLPNLKPYESRMAQQAGQEPRFTNIRVPTGLPFDNCYALSPDGQQLAYLEKGSVWLVPVHGETDPKIAGAPRQITQPNKSWTQTTDMTWSLDGKWLAIHAKDRDSGDLEYAVYMVSSNGGDPRRVPLELKSREQILLHDSRLSLSPDGKWLAYTTWPDGGSPADRSVYLAPTDGGPVRRLTQPITSEPTFSPDGKKIAYLSLAGSPDWQPGAERGRQLWITSVDGGSPILVYELPGPGRIYGPTWAPDGRTIAVMVNHVKRYNDDSKEILLIPLGPDGRASGLPVSVTLPHQVTQRPAGWGPGDQIALILYKPPEFAVYTVPSAGGKAVQLTPNWALTPSWAPDGKRIYFLGSDFGREPTIEYVSSRGGKIEKVDLSVSFPQPTFLSGPGLSVSPDGKRVLFAGGDTNRILAVSVEGGDVIELTQGMLATNPCWSPDGESIAFIGYEKGLDSGLSDGDIFIKPLKGGQARKITSQSDLVAHGEIAWSPDGGRIAFYSEEGRKIRLISVGGGPSRVLVDGRTGQPDASMAWSPDGNELLYTTEGRIWKLNLESGKSEEVQTGLKLTHGFVTWSPDGKNIAFIGTTLGTTTPSSETGLWLMEDFLPTNRSAENPAAKQAAREQTKPAPKFREVQIPGKLPGGSQLSPDGRSIAYAVDGSLWIMPLSGKVSPEIPGAPVKLDTGGVEVLPYGFAWSADGEWIAFNSLKPEEGGLKYGMYVVSSQGGQPRKFPLIPFRDGFISLYRLAMSPHGKLLAYLSIDGYEPSRPDDIRGEPGVVLASVEDGTVRRTIESANRPAFSPDGKKIAYRVGNGGAIWVSSIEGGKPQLAIDLGEEKSAGNIFWSPDSRMVAVQPHNGDKELYIVSVDKLRETSASPTRIELPHEGEPAGWTRDGEIGFLFRETKVAIYTVSASGGKPTQITTAGGSGPNWSPDGRKIFFSSNGKLSMVPADGGKVLPVPIPANEPNLISGPPEGGGGNAVSPDGKTIVFSGRIQDKPGVNLWTIPVQGGKPARLTSMPPPAEAHYPSWSPDGKMVAFLLWPEPNNWETPTNIYIIPAQGGDMREITADIDNVAISSLAWSPDGKWIAFYSRDGVVKVIPAESGTVRVVARDALYAWHARLSWSPDGSRIDYLNKDWKVRTVPIDGHGEGEIVNIDIENARIMEAVRSTDGSRFVIKAVTGDTASGQDYRLWLMEDFLPQRLEGR